MLKNIILDKSASTSNKILRFLTLHEDISFFDKEISEKTGVSRGATNNILNQFLKSGLVTRERRGRMWYYSLAPTPLFKYYRIFDNLVELADLANALKSISQKTILYGSTAQGTDTAHSDIDLFIISNQKNKVLKAIRDFRSEREIKPVIQTATEYAISRKKDKAFYDQVSKGIIIFNREPNEQRL